MNQDPLALLLEDDSDDQYNEEKNIPCLHINNDELDLIIDDRLFANDEYTDKIRILLKYLKNDKELTANKYKTFDITIDLTEKELEIQENNPLYGLKYILDLSKQYITSLSIYITAYRDHRQLPFNNLPNPLDNDVLVNIFEIIRECICKYKLTNLIIQWIPVNISNYNQLTNGIIDILNIKTNEIIQNKKQIPLYILFTSQWLKYLSKYNQKRLIDAIKDCQICKDLTLRFDKSAGWLPFDQNALKSMVLIFNAIGNNSYIQSLNILADNFDSNNIAVECGDNDNDRDYNIVNALAKCLEHKTISGLKNNNFSFNLSLDANTHDDFLYCNEKDLHLLLDALYENDNICLNELCLYRNGSNWDSKTIELICDLVESDEHRILNLVLEGDFVSKYSFGMYKVVGFDKLVNCLINKGDDKKEEEENCLELKRISVGTILDDGDSDIYNQYVIKLIEECNIWLGSITIKYEKFNGNFAEIIQGFFNRLKFVYKSLKCIEKELFKIFEMEDVVNLVVGFCKIERFEIFIVDYSDDDVKQSDLNTERAEFRDCLYEFFGKIQYEVTKNRKEFHKFTQEISVNTIGIWRHAFKQPEACVSVIL